MDVHTHTPCPAVVVAFMNIEALLRSAVILRLEGISADYVDFSPDGRWITYITYPDGALCETPSTAVVWADGGG